MQLNSDVRP